MKKIIGAFQAKTHFSRLLARAERGEEVVITKRGRAIAKLVPVDGGDAGASARAAVTRLRAIAKEISRGRFDWDEWKGYRDTGRR